MEIRLGIIEKLPTENRIEFKDLLTEEEYSKYKFSVAEIEEVHANQRLLEIVFLNSQEFFSFFEPALKELMQNALGLTGFKRQEGDRFFLNANRLLLNYLSSIRTFIDHSDTFLNRKFGSSSEQFLEFKKMLSYFFDNSFAYRFFYKLRNYSQHCGLPLNNLHFTVNNERENNSVNGEVKVVFNRDGLLSTYKDWGRQVTLDLKGQEVEFDVHPLVFEMTHNVAEIATNIDRLNAEKVIESALYIKNLTKHLRAENVEVCIFTDIIERNDSEVINFGIVHIPFDTIDSILP